jgi:hypothetical protein
MQREIKELHKAFSNGQSPVGLHFKPDAIEWLNSKDWSIYSDDQLEVIKTILFQEFDCLSLWGSAGSGKTFLIKTIKEMLENLFKVSVILLAPTGVAAANIDGSTIAKQIGFKGSYPVPAVAKRPAVYQSGKYNRKSINPAKLDVAFKHIFIIIDEISMVSSQYLYAIREAIHMGYGNTHKIQFMCVGDIKQLPPVQKNGEEGELNLNSSCVYNPKWVTSATQQVEASSVLTSHIWKDKTVHKDWVVVKKELTTIHRQKDEAFVKELIKVGEGKTLKADSIIASRIFSSIEEARIGAGENCLHLFGSNAEANALNDYWFNRLVEKNAKNRVYNACFAMNGIEGKITEIRHKPNGQIEDFTVTTESGSQVVFDDCYWVKDCTFRPVVQLAVGMKYVQRKNNYEINIMNGYTGVIEDLLEDAILVNFGKYGTKTIKYEVAQDVPMMGNKPVATYAQIPGHAAHGMTIDLRQGSTVDEPMIMVVSKSMTYRKRHGLMYTGLTRVTKPEYLYVVCPGDNVHQRIDLFNKANYVDVEAVKQVKGTGVQVILVSSAESSKVFKLIDDNEGYEMNIIVSFDNNDDDISRIKSQIEKGEVYTVERESNSFMQYDPQGKREGHIKLEDLWYYTHIKPYLSSVKTIQTGVDRMTRKRSEKPVYNAALDTELPSNNIDIEIVNSAFDYVAREMEEFLKEEPKVEEIEVKPEIKNVGAFDLEAGLDLVTSTLEETVAVVEEAPNEVGDFVFDLVISATNAEPEVEQEETSDLVITPVEPNTLAIGSFVISNTADNKPTLVIGDCQGSLFNPESIYEAMLVHSVGLCDKEWEEQIETLATLEIAEMMVKHIKTLLLVKKSKLQKVEDFLFENLESTIYIVEKDQEGNIVPPSKLGAAYALAKALHAVYI